MSQKTINNFVGKTAQLSEQVDKRFGTLIARIDRFMIESFATSLALSGAVVASIKLL